MEYVDSACEWVSTGVTVGLPRYLKACPVPSTAEGWLELNKEQWQILMPLIAFGVAMVVIVISSLLDTSGKWKDEVLRLQKQLAESEGQVNHLIALEKAKVVDTIAFDKVNGSEKLVMCRCWKSEKFPYCNGAHVKHNKETGDNVGPLIITGGLKKE